MPPRATKSSINEFQDAETCWLRMKNAHRHLDHEKQSGLDLLKAEVVAEISKCAITR